MSHHLYLTAPLPTKQMPPGVPYIVGNEAAERFSYYGMKAILTVFMTQYLLNAAGQKDTMSEPDATACYHWFSAANYAFPVLGALLADLWLGKYRTIIWLSLVYCLGHLALAVDETRIGLFLGLTLVAIGSGGIKPCVSAHVGDQFSSTNKHLLERVYGWFYFSINFGSMFSTMLTPWLLEHPWFGPKWAFGVPGILMAIATIVFWMGRHKFVHVPARGVGFLKESLSPEGLKILLRLSVIFLFIAVFWSLYDQSGSKWVLQAEHMNRRFLGFDWKPAQIQAVNPILVMLFIPLFTLGIYPLSSRFMTVTPLGKMSVGFFFAMSSFAVSGLAEVWIQAGQEVNVAWQLLSYVLMTVGEVMIYFTALEFSYTQAPPTMKSFVMALNLLSVTVGNVFTALVNSLISQNAEFEKVMHGANYYWFFTTMMGLAACLFVGVALTYRGKTYLQDEAGLVADESGPQGERPA